MCDTIGFYADGTAFFAKNSDRSANEPQVLRYFEPAVHREATVQTTYVPVEQVRETHGLLLSKPTWLWGGEMGVNDCGVCIGNEAVWTRGPYQKEGLTGMDMLRLALERGETARAALEVLQELLARYGQGGNCGYDHAFYYDNSFLIMDRNELYVLETAGRHWTYRKSARAAISNRLSIRRDGGQYSGGKVCDFTARFADPVYTLFSGSGRRKALNTSALERAADERDCIRALRQHAPSVRHPFAAGSVQSPCMHAGGLVGDQTTASLVAVIGDRVRVYATGSSAPCLSLFKPVVPDRIQEPVFAPEDPAGAGYWYARERFLRGCIGRAIPADYVRERDALESGWIRDAERLTGDAYAALCRRAAEEERAFYARWSKAEFPPVPTSGRFARYWRKKTAVLEREMAALEKGSAGAAAGSGEGENEGN